MYSRDRTDGVDFICARCGAQPVETRAIKKRKLSAPVHFSILTPRELEHPDYAYYGWEGRRYLKEIKEYLGEKLCWRCHPSSMNSRIELYRDEELEAAEARLLKKVKAELQEARIRNPEITLEERRELAIKLISVARKKEPFRYNAIEIRLRRNLRRAIQSNLAFRYLEKGRLTKPLIDTVVLHDAMVKWESAKEQRDFLSARMASDEIREEVLNVRANVKALLDDSQTPRRKKVQKWPSLQNSVEQIEEILYEAEERIVYLKEECLEKMTPLIDENEEAWTNADREVMRLEALLLETYDPTKRRRLNLDVHDARNELTKYANRAMDYLSKDQIDTWLRELAEQWEIVRKYRGLLYEARHIYPIVRGPNGDVQDVTDRNLQYRNVDNRKAIAEDRWVHCDACDGWTQKLSMVRGALVIRKVSPGVAPGPVSASLPGFGKGASAGKVEFDFLSMEQAASIREEIKENPELAKRYSKLDLFLCHLCRFSGDFVQRVKARDQKRVNNAEAYFKWKDKYRARLKEEEYAVEKAKKDHRRKLEEAVFWACDAVKEMGADFAAPIIHFAPKHEAELHVVVIKSPFVGMPDRLEYGDRTIRIWRETYSTFASRFLWTYLPDKEKAIWRKAMKARGFVDRNGVLLNRSEMRILDRPSEIASALGMELPEFPASYWHGLKLAYGASEIHPNLREVIDHLKVEEFEPLAIYPPVYGDKVRELAYETVKKERDRAVREDREFTAEDGRDYFEAAYQRYYAEALERRKEIEKDKRKRANDQRRRDETPWYMKKRIRGGAKPGPKDKKTVRVLPEYRTYDQLKNLPPAPVVQQDLSGFVMLSKPYEGLPKGHVPFAEDQERRQKKGRWSRKEKRERGQ